MGEQLSLAAVRDALIREEDSIAFALIERARLPRNSPAYAPAAAGPSPSSSSGKPRFCTPRLDTTKSQKMFHSFPKIFRLLCFLPMVTQRFCTLSHQQSV